MPAVLIEAGFINSDKDNELFDNNFNEIAQGIADAIIDTLDDSGISATDAQVYTIQVGAFRNGQLANNMAAQLKAMQFPAMVVFEDGLYKVRVGEFKSLDNAVEMEQRLRKAQFTFDDYLEYMGQIKNMGGLSSLINMIPGVGGQIKDDMLPDEKQLGKIEAIIFSMTKEERGNPDLINPSRKRRIANGAGVDISEVNKLVKQFEQARKMMKNMPGMMGGRKKRGGFKMPFGF